MTQKWHSYRIGCFGANAANGQIRERRQISLTGASQLPVKIRTTSEGDRKIKTDLDRQTPAASKIALVMWIWE